MAREWQIDLGTGFEPPPPSSAHEDSRLQVEVRSPALRRSGVVKVRDGDDADADVLYSY